MDNRSDQKGGENTMADQNKVGALLEALAAEGFNMGIF
jgi:hypothetical protein